MCLIECKRQFLWSYSDRFFLLVLIWRSFVWYDDGYNNEPLFNFHHKTEPLWMKAMSFEGLSWNVLGWNKFVFLERSRCNHSYSWGLNFEFYHTLYLFIFSWFQKQISSEDSFFFFFELIKLIKKCQIFCENPCSSNSGKRPQMSGKRKFLCFSQFCGSFVHGRNQNESSYDIAISMTNSIYGNILFSVNECLARYLIDFIVLKMA